MTQWTTCSMNTIASAQKQNASRDKAAYRITRHRIARHILTHYVMVLSQREATRAWIFYRGNRHPCPRNDASEASMSARFFLAAISVLVEEGNKVFQRLLKLRVKRIALSNMRAKSGRGLWKPKIALQKKPHQKNRTHTCLPNHSSASCTVVLEFLR